jgi:hypothetical protein
LAPRTAIRSAITLSCAAAPASKFIARIASVSSGSSSFMRRARVDSAVSSAISYSVTAARVDSSSAAESCMRPITAQRSMLSPDRSPSGSMRSRRSARSKLGQRSCCCGPSWFLRSPMNLSNIRRFSSLQAFIGSITRARIWSPLAALPLVASTDAAFILSLSASTPVLKLAA